MNFDRTLQHNISISKIIYVGRNYIKIYIATSSHILIITILIAKLTTAHTFEPIAIHINHTLQCLSSQISPTKFSMSS